MFESSGKCDMKRRIGLRVAATMLAAAGAVMLSAGSASANEALPSNCWWTSNSWVWAADSAAGIAGYCVGPGGSVEWFDWNGGYGNAWWM